MTELRERNVIGGPSGTLFRREAIERVGGCDESFLSREDVDLWIRILAEYSMYGVGEVLYDRLIHDDQMIADDELTIRGQRRVLERHGDRLSPGHRALRRYSIARALAELGRPGEARSELRTAIGLAPRARTLYYYWWLLFGSVGYRVGRIGHVRVYHRLRRHP